MSPEPTRVYLCRHARTALNADGQRRGHLDPPLDAHGHVGVDALGKALESLSPAPRGVQPTDRRDPDRPSRGQLHRLEISIDPRLIDRDYGPWAGRREEDAVAWSRRNAGADFTWLPRSSEGGCRG